MAVDVECPVSARSARARRWRYQARTGERSRPPDSFEGIRPGPLPEEFRLLALLHYAPVHLMHPFRGFRHSFENDRLGVLFGPTGIDQPLEFGCDSGHQRALMLPIGFICPIALE